MQNKGTVIIKEPSCRSCLSNSVIDDDTNYINDIILPRILNSQEPTSLRVRRSGSFQSIKTDNSQPTVQELQSKMQLKQAYVQYVGHEIRTPLQVINSGLALLKDDLKNKVKTLMSEKVNRSCQLETSLRSNSTYKTESETGTFSSIDPATASDARCVQLVMVDELCQDLELVEIMHESTLTAVNILNDLLLYEKLESNMLGVEQTSAHLFDIVIPIVKMFTIPVTAAEITLTWDLDSLLSVYALLDASKFGQVMRNLISNAMKFTPRGGSVHVSAFKIAEPAQPSPPSTEMPSPITRRPSLRLFSRKSSFTSVDDNACSSPVTTTAVDRFSASFQVGEGVDIQQQPVEPHKQEPTLYRISVRDSGCGISQV